MSLKLIRTLGTDTETLGYIEYEGKHVCYTLEDAVRDHKIKEETCIPYGEYKVKLTYSPRFKKDLPLIYNNPITLNVESKNGDIWSGVRLHGGNWHGHTEGCPLVAENQYINKPTSFTKDGKKYAVNNWMQGSYEEKLTKLIKDKNITSISIVHVDSLKKETLYRLRNPMMKDDVIIDIQQALKSAGYNITSPDGWFGKETHDAVMQFQLKNNITVDGIVGNYTLKKLGIVK